MEYIKKEDLREQFEKKISAIPDDIKTDAVTKIHKRLFDFANFLESKIVFLYYNQSIEVTSLKMCAECLKKNKILVLPNLTAKNFENNLLKIDDLEKDLVLSEAGIFMPVSNRLKNVPIDCIDIAIIPGIVFDEKGGRIGKGDGFYDQIIPKLPITARKVALALEAQLVPQVPMESHDKFVDIIITEDRLTYKI